METAHWLLGNYEASAPHPPLSGHLLPAGEGKKQREADSHFAKQMMSELHHALLSRFYKAFQQRDGAAMSACYHADATFRDPVFELRGTDVGAMWRMLCSRSNDLRIEYANVTVDATNGSADWQAWYTFSTTRRAVHNIVHSQFRFADSLIIEQVDTFAFWRWSRQALGPAGTLLGWTPMLHGKVRANARTALARYMDGEHANE